MWSKLCHKLNNSVFKAPTIDEINKQKLRDATTELASAMHAKKVAEYRIHCAEADIAKVRTWDMKEGAKKGQGGNYAAP